MIAEIVQWANEEFAGEGWTFREDNSSSPSSPIRFVHGSSRDHLTRIVIMVTSWAVTWHVFDESVGYGTGRDVHSWFVRARPSEVARG